MPKSSKKSSKKGKNKAKTEEEELIRQQKADTVIERFKTLYQIYDQDETGSIGEDDFGDFVRSLGLYPTNAKLKELADECKEEGADGCYPTTKLESVLAPLVVEAILNPTSELAPPSEEQLLLALKSLDLDHKGHLAEGDFRTLLSTNGEKLDPEELEPAVDEAVNPATGVVDLERYASRLLYNSKLF